MILATNYYLGGGSNVFAVKFKYLPIYMYILIQSSSSKED